MDQRNLEIHPVSSAQVIWSGLVHWISLGCPYVCMAAKRQWSECNVSQNGQPKQKFLYVFHSRMATLRDWIGAFGTFCSQIFIPIDNNTFWTCVKLSKIIFGRKLAPCPHISGHECILLLGYVFYTTLSRRLHGCPQLNRFEQHYLMLLRRNIPIHKYLSKSLVIYTCNHPHGVTTNHIIQPNFCWHAHLMEQ